MEEQERKVDQDKKESKILLKVKNDLGSLLLGLREVFSVQNLFLSLLSAGLVLGAAYLLPEVTQILYKKSYSNQTLIMLLVYIITYVSFILAIIGPALIYGSKTKKWDSFVYIILLQIIWFSIILAVVYFRAPEQTYQDFSQYLTE